MEEKLPEHRRMGIASGAGVFWTGLTEFTRLKR
jgi:hypothetical protein